VRRICAAGDGQVKYVGYDLVSRDDKPSFLVRPPSRSRYYSDAKIYKDKARVYKEAERELNESQFTAFKKREH
jgi:hypothetical protein